MTTVDDAVVPFTGILDVKDKHAFVHTSGYLSGPDDVYVPMSQVRRFGLRPGDEITGASKPEQQGRRDALARLDTVNGLDPAAARQRPDFYALTPLYPQERMRLETEPHLFTTRVIDLV